jgi:phosphate transport system regulatory protein PhoU
MGEHTVSSFDQELDEIGKLIREMADLSSAMVGASIRALVDADQGAAQRVISDDAVMDARQRELDDRSIKLIARRQPMAQDLRSVLGAIRMAADFERIGDLAKNVAKRVGAVGQATTPTALSHGILDMSHLVLRQIEEVTHAYIERKPEVLPGLRTGDEAVDRRYTSIFRELLTYMMEDPRNITPCTHLLFCAKNLERIGDHVTNIAENAYFVLTGQQLPAYRPKLDETGMVLSAE